MDPDVWAGGAGHGDGSPSVALQPPAGSGLSPYSSTILVVDEIDQVRCTSGGLNFQSKTFSRFVDVEEGDRPLQDGVSARLTSGTVFSWSLFVDESNPEVLQGHYAIVGDQRDDATVTATRP